MTPSDTPRPKRKPGRTPEAEAREAERKERLAAALRQNLRRRKAGGGAPKASGADDGD